MMRETGLKHSESGDIGLLIDWVSYHDVMARFSSRHWRHESIAINEASDRFQSLKKSPCVRDKLVSS